MFGVGWGRVNGFKDRDASNLKISARNTGNEIYWDKGGG